MLFFSLNFTKMNTEHQLTLESVKGMLLEIEQELNIQGNSNRFMYYKIFPSRFHGNVSLAGIHVIHNFVVKI